MERLQQNNENTKLKKKIKQPKGYIESVKNFELNTPQST